MEHDEAKDTIARGRRLLDDWLHGPDGGPIKDRDVTRCLQDLREAARHVSVHEADAIAKVVELAELRLNSPH